MKILIGTVDIPKDFEFYLLFNVTCNDISVIYVTAHNCAGGRKKKFHMMKYHL